MVLQGKLCGRVGRRRDYLNGNPKSVPKPSSEGPRQAKLAASHAGSAREEANPLPALSFSGWRRPLETAEARQVAAELFGDEVFEAVGATGEAMACAVNLAAGRLAFFDFTQVFFEPCEAVRPQGAGVVEVAELACAGGPRPAENRR